MRIKLTTNKELDSAFKEKVPTDKENIKIIAFLEKSETITLFYPWPESDKTPHILLLEERINLENFKRLYNFIKELKDEDLLILSCYDGLSVSRILAETIIDSLPTHFDLTQWFELEKNLPEFPPANESLRFKLYQLFWIANEKL